MYMKKIVFIISGTLLITGAFFIWVFGQDQREISTKNLGEGVQGGQIITLTPDGFSPKNLTVQKGDTIVFISTRGKWFWPASNPHPTHTIYTDFDPGEPVAESEMWSFKFEKTGEWKYHDHLAPYFTGTITVRESSGIRDPLQLHANTAF